MSRHRSPPPPLNFPQALETIRQRKIEHLMDRGATEAVAVAIADRLFEDGLLNDFAIELMNDGG